MQTSDFKAPVTNEECLKRIHKIKGQVAGVEKMVEGKSGCLETVQQILAAKNALASLAVEILYQESCKIESKTRRKELLEKIFKEV